MKSKIASAVFADVPLASAPFTNFSRCAATFCWILLAHDFAQLVRLGEREARDIARHAHDLLLIDRDAVGVTQNRLERGVDVLRLAAPVLDRDVLRNLLHRAGADTARRAR